VETRVGLGYDGQSGAHRTATQEEECEREGMSQTDDHTTRKERKWGIGYVLWDVAPILL